MYKQLVTLTLMAFFLPVLLAQPRGKELPQGVTFPQQTSGVPAYQLININNITCWSRMDGQSAHAPWDQAGVSFPRGIAGAVYEDGILWAAKAFLDSGYTTPVANQTIRVGGQTYNQGTRQGWITGQGANAVAVDPTLPALRVYRIRRDFRNIPYEESRTDAAEFFGVPRDSVRYSHIQQLYDYYNRDWSEWPVEHGAPYIERNGIPGYQPPPAFSDPVDLITNHYDEPGIAGIDPSLPADMVMWIVCNDLDRTFTLGLYGSEPLGLEMQVTLWAYKQNGAGGNIYFKRVRIINKGGVNVGGGQRGSFWLDSVFVAQWSDTDLGDNGDDLLGCDTTQNLAFVYNGSSADREYLKFNLPPPALGYSLLYGPLVPGTGNDSGAFDFHRVYGKRNLPMTSFSPKGSGMAVGDPSLGSNYESTLQWWRWIQGYLPYPSTVPLYLYPFPPGMPPSRFPWSGDPVAHTGFLDGLGTNYSLSPGDRRFTASSGPFRLAPGDTQEVLIATVGGLGADRLSSISALKYNLRSARQAANLLFAVPAPPARPVARAIELDRAIVLEWGSDLQRVQQTEQRIVAGGYRFEGYNVYQLPSPTSSPADGVRIATFDVIDGVRQIVENTVDPVTGLIVPYLAQRGSDSGVQRYLRVTKDSLHGRSPLYNGSSYVFAVSAYNYSASPDAFPKSLESTATILSATPQIPFGIASQKKTGDTLSVHKTSGKSNGTVTPIVLDPLSGTGDVYRVGFDTSGGVVTWNVTNISRTRVIVEKQTNQSGDMEYPLLEGGILPIVYSPPHGLKPLGPTETRDTTQWGWRWFSGSPFLTSAFGRGLRLEGFGGAAGWSSPRSALEGQPMVLSPYNVKNVEIKFAPTSDNAGTFDPSHPDASYAYRYGRNFSLPPARPEFAQWIIHSATGFAYQDYRSSVPLAVYDVDATPPRRLAIGFLENNLTQGAVNGFYWPPYETDNVSSGGPSEWLFIFDADYTGATPVPQFQADILQGDNMPVMYLITWTREPDIPWPDGNVMALHPNIPNGPADHFDYTVPASVTNQALQRQSAARVGVFPNPYYAGQSAVAIRQGRFVTFTNLPPKATIRIFNLAGHLVRTLIKDEPSQFLEWDLTNSDSWLVASGIYICHVEMAEVGTTKILKLAVIQGGYIPPVK